MNRLFIISSKITTAENSIVDNYWSALFLVKSSVYVSAHAQISISLFLSVHLGGKKILLLPSEQETSFWHRGIVIDFFSCLFLAGNFWLIPFWATGKVIAWNSRFIWNAENKFRYLWMAIVSVKYLPCSWQSPRSVSYGDGSLSKVVWSLFFVCSGRCGARLEFYGNRPRIIGQDFGSFW